MGRRRGSRGHGLCASVLSWKLERGMPRPRGWRGFVGSERARSDWRHMMWATVVSFWKDQECWWAPLTSSCLYCWLPSASLLFLYLQYTVWCRWRQTAGTAVTWICHLTRDFLIGCMVVRPAAATTAAVACWFAYYIAGLLHTDLGATTVEERLDWKGCILLTYAIT